MPKEIGRIFYPKISANLFTFWEFQTIIHRQQNSISLLGWTLRYTIIFYSTQYTPTLVWLNEKSEGKKIINNENCKQHQNKPNIYIDEKITRFACMFQIFLLKLEWLECVSECSSEQETEERLTLGYSDKLFCVNLFGGLSPIISHTPLPSSHKHTSDFLRLTDSSKCACVCVPHRMGWYDQLYWDCMKPFGILLIV